MRWICWFSFKKLRKWSNNVLLFQNRWDGGESKYCMYPSSLCKKGVGNNLIFCTDCLTWLQKWFIYILFLLFGPVASWVLHWGLHTKSSRLWLILWLLYWPWRLFWPHSFCWLSRSCEYHIQLYQLRPYVHSIKLFNAVFQGTPTFDNFWSKHHRQKSHSSY